MSGCRFGGCAPPEENSTRQVIYINPQRKELDMNRNRTVGQNEVTPLEIVRRANAYPRLVISVENSVAIIGMLLDLVPLAQRDALLACMNERRTLLRSLEDEITEALANRVTL